MSAFCILEKQNVCALFTFYCSLFTSAQLFSYTLLDGSAKLVGTAGGLHAATNTIKLADDVGGLHAYDDLGEALGVAVTTAIETAGCNDVILYGHLYELAAGAMGLVDGLPCAVLLNESLNCFHGKYSIQVSQVITCSLLRS